MNYRHKSTKILIAGSSGTGKTTFWLEYIHRSFHSLKFIFDGEGEFIQRGKHGLICQTPEQLVERVQQIIAGEHNTNIIIFDPSKMFAGDIENAFDFFCEWVFAFSEASPMVPKLFAVDELQNVIHTAVIPQSFRKVLETGRRYSLDFAGITQALNLIHNRIRNQITELICFRTSEKRALEYIESLELDPDTISRLRDLRFIARDLRTGQVQAGKMRPWKDPRNSKIIVDDEPACDLIGEALNDWSPWQDDRPETASLMS